jgi:hypothetical protein
LGKILTLKKEKRKKEKTLLQTKSVLGEPSTTIQQGYLRFGTSVFFIGEFSQKFNLKNVMSTNTKDFSWEKWSKFAKFRK